jgi:ParB family chromosome partitioning protein
MGSKVAFANAKRANLFRIDPAELVLIVDTDHPLYDERVHLPVEESLVRNIAVYGVIEPVIVAKLGDQPVVVDGRQRVKAAREASDRLEKEGRERIMVPCFMRRGNAEALFGVSISANEHRKDDSPLGKSDKLLRLLAIGRTEEDCADIFGVSGQTIANWLVLAELPNAIKDAVDRGVLSATAAASLHGLDHKACKTALASLIAAGAKPGKRASKRKVAQTTGKVTYKFRSKADAIEAAPAKYHEDIKPLLAGSPAARISRIASELGSVEGIRTNPAFVALKALVDSGE